MSLVKNEHLQKAKLIISLSMLMVWLPNKPNGPVIEPVTWSSLLIWDADGMLLHAQCQ